MPFFWSGKATREMPGIDGSDAERDELERKHTDLIHKALQRMMRAVAPTGTTTSNISPDVAVQRYRENQSLLRDALVAMLTDGAMLGADVGKAQTEWLMGVGKAATIVGVDWDLINSDVLAWVMGGGEFGGGFGQGYADTVLTAMATTSERQLRTLIAEWIRNDLTYRQLVDDLSRSLFSQSRAEMVATTEITRAYAEGNRAAWQRGGIIDQMRWYTSADERVCPICGALHLQISNVNGDFGNGMLPPAHPRCRCFLQPYIERSAPAAIGQPPTTTPGQTSPQGTPVSAALRLPDGGQYAATYRNAVNTIDSVHGDGELPNLRVTTQNSSQYLGAYRHYADGTPAGISIKGNSTQIESTLAHEVGHFLDHQVIGKRGEFASKSHPLMEEWRQAVSNSEAVKTLANKHRNPLAYTVETGNGTATPSRVALEYYADPVEVWARSYSQYIATKSGDATMLAQIEEARRSRLYGEQQWDTEDFKPIEAAIDNLFRGLGWLK